MKKLIFTLPFLFSFFFSQASTNSYDPDSICSVTIDTIQNGFCFQANPTGTAPFTYLWNDSTTNSSTCSNVVFNQYCVTVVDATGCVATACTGPPAPSCDVWITAIDSFPNSSTFELNGSTTGVGQLTYLWSTGETSGSIVVDQSGTYCVTITDGNGCVDSDCTTVTINTGNICSVDVIENVFCLSAVPSGTAPYTYLWDNGSTSEMLCDSSLIGDTICVTVTDANGCVSTDCGIVAPNFGTCYVSISETALGLMAIPTSIPNASGYSYLWSTGETTVSISPMATGDYCVTITNLDNNCTASSCWYYDINGGCSLTIFPVQGTSCLQANPVGVAPFTYMWSDGTISETACINNPAGDSLCVTVTDAAGCVSTACGSVGGSSCQVSIAFIGPSLMAEPSGDPNGVYTFLWSTGETTQTITPLSSGAYEVTITTANGCTSSTGVPFTYHDGICGWIGLDTLGSNNAINSFKVYLIEYDSIAGTLTAIDSTIVTSSPNSPGSGYYSFLALPDGDYLVKGALTVGSDDYDDYLPTYYGNVLFWDDATTITSPGYNNFRNITLIYGDNPGGPGFIGGLISEGANFVSGQVETRDEGDPIANVSIILLTEAGTPVTHAISNDEGEFSFPDLAYGTYEVVVEILGKEQGRYMVTIGPDDSSEYVNFTVTEGTITDIHDILNGETLKVFPNPVTSDMNIQIDIHENIQLNISVINLLGKTMLTENVQLNQGNQMMRISLQNLPTGVYFLNLSDGETIISKKILKQ